MKPALTVGLAFAVFAAIHSLTVSNRFKGIVQGLLGERFMRAWYRLTFTVFSSAISAALVATYLIQPDIFVYRPPGYVLWPTHAVQIAGIYILFAASRPFKPGFFAGVSQAKVYLTTGSTGGDIEGIPQGGLVTSGVYGLVRHPMYLGGMLMFAFEPNLTVNCLVVRIMAVAYFVYGGLVEDIRLVERFGDEYRAYRERVPMFNIAAGLMRLRQRGSARW